MKDLVLKIKLFCMALGGVKDVTNQYELCAKLRKFDFRILKSAKNMLYVVCRHEILFKSVSSYFKIIYSEYEGAFIFRTWENYKTGSQVYKVMTNEMVCLEEISGFGEFYEIKDFPLVLVREGDIHSIIYDYEHGKIIIDEKAEINWLENAKIFVERKRFEKCSFIVPRIYKGEVICEKKDNILLDNIPKDVFVPQLIGNKILQLGSGTAIILRNFEHVEKADWLPFPYEYWAESDEKFYMLGVTDDVNMLEIDGDEICPLVEDFPGMEDFFVIRKDNSLSVVQYDGAEQLVRLGAVDGIEIRLAEPKLDIKKGVIKIPLKVVSERYFNEE